MPSVDDGVRLLVATGVGAAVGNLTADAPVWGAVAAIAMVAGARQLRGDPPRSRGDGREAADPPPLRAVAVTALACIALAVAATASDAAHAWRPVGALAVALRIASGGVAVVAGAAAVARHRAVGTRYGAALLGIAALSMAAELAAEWWSWGWWWDGVVCWASSRTAHVAIALGIALGATATARSASAFRGPWLALGLVLLGATLLSSSVGSWRWTLHTQEVSWPHLAFARLGSPVLRRTVYDVLVFAGAASRVVFGLLATFVALDRDPARRNDRARRWMWGALAVEVPGLVADFPRWDAPYPHIDSRKLGDASTLACAVLGFVLAAHGVGQARARRTSKR